MGSIRLQAPGAQGLDVHPCVSASSVCRPEGPAARCPKAPAPHSPLLYTAIPDAVTVTGDNGALAVFKNGLCTDTGQVDTLAGDVCVSGISPADLSRVLTLAEQGGLQVQNWED